jgi:hypothetical protein
MSPPHGFPQFIHGGRTRMQFNGKSLVRAVHRSAVVRKSEVSTLEAYMADRLPYFYTDPKDITDLFGEGHFLAAIQTVLAKLPSAKTFQDSHFAEILAAIYAEEVLGLGRIYSKLALLTAENANAYKMDVLLYQPGTDPIEFVLAEVKSSTKTAADGLPARHDVSCFSSLFQSLNSYDARDLDFDLARVRERLGELPPADQETIKRSLLPHRSRSIRYAGFCVIDSSTHDAGESELLATRKNSKTFDVDLLCVAELPDVMRSTYDRLSRVA